MKNSTQLLLTLLFSFFEQETNVATIFHRTADANQAALIERIAENHTFCTVNIDGRTNADLVNSLTGFPRLVALDLGSTNGSGQLRELIPLQRLTVLELADNCSQQFASDFQDEYMLQIQVCAQAPTSSDNNWTRYGLDVNGTSRFQSKMLYRNQSKDFDSRLHFWARKLLICDTANERQAQMWQKICRKCLQCPDKLDPDHFGKNGTLNHLGFGRDSGECVEEEPTFSEKLQARLLNHWIPQLVIVVAAIRVPRLASSSFVRRWIGDVDWSWLGWSSVISTVMLFGMLLILESAAAGITMPHHWIEFAVRICLLMLAIGQTIELSESKSCRMRAKVSQWAAKQTRATLSAVWILLALAVATIIALSAANQEGDFSIVGTENRARAHWTLDAITLVGCCVKLAHIIRQVKRLHRDGLTIVYSILFVVSRIVVDSLLIWRSFEYCHHIIDATAFSIDQAERVSYEILRANLWRMLHILANRLAAMLVRRASSIYLPGRQTSA